MAEIQVANSRGQGYGLVTTFPYAAKAIIKSDSDYYNRPIAVFVGGAGDVSIIPWIGDRTTPVVFPMPAGQVVPCLAYKVLAATTATDLIALS